jgi:hypothetical protein
MKPFSVSAKNLAALNLADRCDHCLWYLLHVNFKVPFNIFPGIFSSFDARQKRLVRLYFEKHESAPTWFGPFGDAVRCLNTGRMEHHHDDTNIKIVGEPDVFVELADGTLAVLDYKTARFTKGQDELLDLYKAQLAAYCLMASNYGYGEISRAGLIYFEPSTDDDDKQAVLTIHRSGFSLSFKARPVEIEIDLDNLEVLLEAARKLYDLEVPPNPSQGCKDCKLLARLYELGRNVERLKAAVHQSGVDAIIDRKMRRIRFEDYLSVLRAMDKNRQHALGMDEFIWDWTDYDLVEPLAPLTTA